MNAPLRKKAWPAHYSETDIARISAVLAWLKATKRSRQWFVSKVTYGKSSVLNTLNGYYASNPKPVLDAMEEAIGTTPSKHAFATPAMPERVPTPVAVAHIPAPIPDISIPLREAEQQAPQAAARAGEWEPGAYHWPTPSERIQGRIHKLIGRSSAANPMLAGDLIALLGGDEAIAWRALESLIAARQVMTAIVWKAGLSSQVVYPMGRIPTTKPGPKGRGQEIRIAPSNSARSIHRGTGA